MSYRYINGTSIKPQLKKEGKFKGCWTFTRKLSNNEESKIDLKYEYLYPDGTWNNEWDFKNPAFHANIESAIVALNKAGINTYASELNWCADYNDD